MDNEMKQSQKDLLDLVRRPCRAWPARSMKRFGLSWEHWLCQCTLIRIRISNCVATAH